MRVTEDRYCRERRRMELALRFIRNEARTRTIRTWTGLTDDRIRKLYRSYIRVEPSARVRRRRGKSPQQIAFFLRSRPAQLETAALASIMTLCGVVGPAAAATPSVSVADAVVTERPARAQHLQAEESVRCLPRGERLCTAFDAYRRAAPQSTISFEHAVFLATTLVEGHELRTLRCAICGSLGVVDPAALRAQSCLDCGEVLVPPWHERMRTLPPRVSVHRVPPTRTARIPRPASRSGR